MYRLVAWAENLDPAAAQVNIAAVPDNSINTFGDFIRVPADTRFLIGEYVNTIVATPTEAVIQSPSLRVLSNQFVSNIVPGTFTVGDFAAQMHELSPREFLVNEDVEFLLTATGGVAVNNYAAMMLADGPIQKVNGPIFTTRLTAAIAQAALTWTNGVLTFIERLPVRDYDVVGMRVQSADGIVARLIFPGSNVRPGVPCFAGIANFEDQKFRWGNMGVMGRFNLNQPPQLEILGGAAVAQTVYLDLVPA